MKVTVVGLGYIGLPTAAMLAEGGHQVAGYDISEAVRIRLRNGAAHVTEPEVRSVVARALASARLSIVDEIAPADVYILCVPTPSTHEGRPDLTYVQSAATAIAPLLKRGDLIILESTVPPGTTERTLLPALRALGVNVDDVFVAHCPERVIPGNIVTEMRQNARVIGGRTAAAAALARDLYAAFVQGDMYLTDCTTAEFVKVVENTYRDVNIAFANELAMLADELEIDVWEAIQLANCHPRVNILKPGPGVGGHCIPVDPRFLYSANPFVTELIQTARRVNDRMPDFIARKVLEAAPMPPYGRKIALLGAAYKANVDDTRESPTLKIDELLRERGYETAIYDPLASDFARPLASSLEEALSGADALVLVTDHDAFRSIDPAAAGARMRARNLIDARKFFPQAPWRQAGFQVYVLGGLRSGEPLVLAVR